MTEYFETNGKAFTISRRGLIRLCSLRDEYYEFVENPVALLRQLKGKLAGKADLFTFTEPVSHPEPRFSYHLEFDSAAVLVLTTFEHWWRKQINDKTRNMVRKAQKAGVEIRAVEFGDDLVRGIQAIYDEVPFRQGRRFKHYGKDLETLHREHGTFLAQSQFFGSYYDGKLIGFIKLVHGRGVSWLMNILSMILHRNKAPNNALIAKAVEVCAEQGVCRLQYGTGNSGSIGEFKKHHAFQEVRVSRYFVPLNRRGEVALRFDLHHGLERYLPRGSRDYLLKFRAKWFAFRYADPTGARSATPAEQRAKT